MNAAGVDGASDGAAPAVPATPEARAPHRQCIGCGYDVVGLPVDGPCAECGRTVRETVDRFILRSEPTAAASIRRARIGFYGMLGVLGILVCLIVLGIFSAVTQTSLIDRVINSIGPEALALTICTAAAISAGVITSGFCIAPKVRRLRAVALGLIPPIVAFPWVANLTSPRTVSELVPFVLFAGMMLSIGALAAIFVRAVRTTALACDDFKFLTLARRWSWVIVFWIALVAIPVTALIVVSYLTTDNFGIIRSRWLQTAMQLYILLFSLPLTLITLLTSLLLTFRMLRVAKAELAAAPMESA